MKALALLLALAACDDARGEQQKPRLPGHCTRVTGPAHYDAWRCEYNDAVCYVLRYGEIGVSCLPVAK